MSEDRRTGGAERRRLGTTGLEVTALTMNEMATFGATVELQARGLQIPRDFSVRSIVTSPGVGAMSDPPLTTMHTPGAELGRLGGEVAPRPPPRGARSTRSIPSC